MKHDAHLTRRTHPATRMFLVLAGIFILGGCSAKPINETPKPSNATTATTEEKAPAPAPVPASFAKLAENVKHFVVNLSTSYIVEAGPANPFMEPAPGMREFFGQDFFNQFFGGMRRAPMQAQALGSGVVIDNEGHILTNNHVVQNATQIKVRLLNQVVEYDAKIVGRDPKTELALIKVEPDANFPVPAQMGDSDAIQVGDWVMAVGNPFGLGHTVTVGIISAKGRVIGAGPYDDFLQTDAAINPGNSGGPLLDMNGRIIGINTAIMAAGQGIGFAIPINMARTLLPQLKTGKVVRGYLGIVIQDVTPDLASAFGLDKAKGVIISEVLKDGPADKAGLRRGDIVLEMNNEAIKNAHAFSSRVAEIRPDEKVEMQILQDGNRKTISVVIGTMPTDKETKPETPPATKQTWGLSVQELTPPIAQAIGLGSDEHGVIVTAVEAGSLAQSAGIQPGDLIKEVDRQPIENMNQYKTALLKHKGKGEILLLIQREGHTLYTVLPAAGEE